MTDTAHDHSAISSEDAPAGSFSGKRDLFTMNRRQRRKIREENKRHADKAREAQQRPGSNTPPVSAVAVEAYWKDKKEAIVEILDRAQITPQSDHLLLQEIVASSRAHHGGANLIQAYLWAVEAMVRRTEQVDIAGTTLREFDALSHVHIVHNAIRDALAGNLAPFRAMLPALGDPFVVAPPVTTGASIRAAAIVGLAVLTMGKAKRGGISQAKAKAEVSAAFREEGIEFKEDTVLQWAKNLNHGKDPDACTLFERMIGPVRTAAQTYWPIKHRRAALKRLADEAGRKLET